MLRLAVILSTVLVLLALPTAAIAETKPNIVVFLSDDMGWGQLGFQGGKGVATPNIDRLAREGTSLSQFYVLSVCSPTRASLLTGRFPFRNGMEERSHGSDTAGMLTDERTLAQALHDAGYYTAIFGKWHLGEWKKEHLPLARGFDHQYGHYSALIDSFTHCRGVVYDWHRNEQPLDEDGYSTFLIADEFSRVLESRDKSKPFFFYVPFNAVHGPHDAPPEYLEKHNGAKQLAMLECMDVAVGRMLAALEKQGVLDDTLVLFFNDNGGPRRLLNEPFRGYKGTTYEGGVRVACVWRWPGKIPAGETVDGMAHVVDLYPTLVNLAGGSLEQPLPLDGLDMWDAIALGKPSPRTEVIHSVPGFDLSETGPPSIRSGDFKLVGDELFDVANDPYEKSDLAAIHPDKVRELKARLEELAAQRRAPEVHNHTPGGPPVVYGEQENAAPIPDWLQKRSEAAKAVSPRPKRRRNQAKEEE